MVDTPIPSVDVLLTTPTSHGRLHLQVESCTILTSPYHVLCQGVLTYMSCLEAFTTGIQKNATINIDEGRMPHELANQHSSSTNDKKWLYRSIWKYWKIDWYLTNCVEELAGRIQKNHSIPAKHGYSPRPFLRRPEESGVQTILCAGKHSHMTTIILPSLPY